MGLRAEIGDSPLPEGFMEIPRITLKQAMAIRAAEWRRREILILLGCEPMPRADLYGVGLGRDSDVDATIDALIAAGAIIEHEALSLAVP